MSSSDQPPTAAQQPQPERKRAKRASRFSDAPAVAAAAGSGSGPGAGLMPGLPGLPAGFALPGGLPGVPAAAAAAAVAAAAAAQHQLLGLQPSGLPGGLMGLPGMGLGMPGAGMMMGMQQPQMDDKTHKALTELFVGNLPMSAAGPALLEFLNAAMVETKLGGHTVSSSGQALLPIEACRHNPGSKFAFIVCRTPEEATNALNMTGIPYDGCMLKIERPGSFPGPKTGAKTWQQLTAALLGGGGAGTGGAGGGGEAGAAGAGGGGLSSALALATAGGGGGLVDPATKQYRELFVGNVVEGTPGQELHEFLGAVMKEVGLADTSRGDPTENPILHVRTSGGKFAFVEMRSVEETNNALNMDGIPFQGMELRIKRPEKFPGNPTPAVSWRTFMEMRTEMAAAEEKQGGRVLMVGGAIRDGEVSSGNAAGVRAVTDDLHDLLKDLGFEVVALVVPRPPNKDAETDAEKGGSYGFDYSAGGAMGADAKGVGNAFVKFKDAAACSEAMVELGKRTFDGKDLLLDFFDESRFDARDFAGC